MKLIMVKQITLFPTEEEQKPQEQGGDAILAHAGDDSTEGFFGNLSRKKYVKQRKTMNRMFCSSAIEKTSTYFLIGGRFTQQIILTVYSKVLALCYQIITHQLDGCMELQWLHLTCRFLFLPSDWTFFLVFGDFLRCERNLGPGI